MNNCPFIKRDTTVCGRNCRGDFCKHHNIIMRQQKKKTTCLYNYFGMTCSKVCYDNFCHSHKRFVENSNIEYQNSRCK